MSAPTILRTQHKLGDYLFEPDLTKFNLPKKSSRPWIINTTEQHKAAVDKVKHVKNLSGMENENNSETVTVKTLITSPVPRKEEISNRIYRENMRETNENENTVCTANIVDNERFCLPRKSWKSPKVKSKMNTKQQKSKGRHNQLYNKNVTHSESQQQDKEHRAHMVRDTHQDTEIQGYRHTHQDTEIQGYRDTHQDTEIQGYRDTHQDTDQDRVNMQVLQLDAELEYQNQINQMYNDPQYMDQLELFYQPELPHPAFHHVHQEHPLAEHILPPHVVQHPLMYFIPMTDTFEDPTPMTMTPDTGSDYSSEDGSCYELNITSDSSDDEVFETKLQPTAFTPDYSGKPFEAEHDYEVPIEMDEELNLLVLSIIDD